MELTQMSLEEPASSMGTGFGDDTRFETNKTTFKREDNADWIAVLNYDTIQGLRRRGVFIENTTAKAFPKMKQDVYCHIPTRG